MPLAFEQSCVGSGFRNPAFVQDDDPVRGVDGVQAVGDDQGGPALRETVQGVPDETLALRVQAGGGLVQEQEGRVLQEGAGYRKPLCLAAGEALAPLPDLGVVTVRNSPDELRAPASSAARSTSDRLASVRARRMFSSTLP